MTSPTNIETRKLAAIMFTDIKGFSAKMARNETIAFELLKTHDALLRVLTAKFDGRIIKSIGDSFMIDFSSAVNAVKCAIEAQKRFSHFNKGKSELEKIEIRIGIHLGDVIIRGEDIIGDGVNIASRIEALTGANRIWISQDVYQQVRNKIRLQTFPLGPQQLKNIPEPIEVYEILIEGIAELATPSAAAVETKSQTQEGQALQQEAEEGDEAKQVEEAKQRVRKESEKGEEERKKKIAEHYARAEKYFEEGKLEKAEKELDEVYQLDPQQRINSERQKLEKEHEKAAQVHLTKARELLLSGQLDAAENEINEIFQQFPLHVGAQGMLLEIEEERYRREEQERTKHAEEQPTTVNENEQRISELLEQARAQLQEEKFSEAIFALHELFRIDPNHSGARRLEETIRQAEQAKEELVRIQAEQAEEEKRSQELANLQRKLEERRQRPRHVPKQVNRSVQYKRLLYIAAILIALVTAIVGIPKLIDWIFPKTTSIAVLRFTTVARDTSKSDLFESLPLLLSEDLAQCEYLTVIAPSTSMLYSSESIQSRKTASMLPVEFLLIGNIQENNKRYSITIRLFNTELQQTTNIGTFEGLLSTLAQVRTAIVQIVLDKMEIKSSLPEIQQPSNTDAYAKYLEGVRLLSFKRMTAIDSAKNLLKSAVMTDTLFGLAYGALGDAELRSFDETGDHLTLKAAMDDARSALRISSAIAIAHQVLGTGYRLSKQYDAALSSITRSLDYLPQNPECYRELALLALIAGKNDDALKYASNAFAHDPQNAESHFTLGLVQHFKKDYSAAANSYQKAQTLGLSDSLLTICYLMNTWIVEGLSEKAVHYCREILRRSPNDYRYYYWIGRAYQLAVKVDVAQQWLEEGLAVTQKCIEADPTDALAYAYAGLFHSRLGKFADGEAAMTRAFQLDSTSAELFFRKADLYSIQRNKQEALIMLKKGLQKQYDFSELFDPDFAFIANEPEFLSTISQDIKGIWPAK